MGIHLELKKSMDAMRQPIRYCLSAIALTVCLFLQIQPIHAQNAGTPAPFVMGAGINSDSGDSRLTRLIYIEAFKRLGIPLEFEHTTLKRRELLAEGGGIDGEPARIYDYGATHPGLIRVEESVLNLSFSLYTASPSLRLDRLEDLATGNLVVEYHRGVVLCESTLKKLLPRDRVSELPSVEQALKKLVAGRTDLYCDIDLLVRLSLHTTEFKDVTTVRKVLDIAKSVPTYPYINKAHAELAPRLALVLRQMKAEGLIDGYQRQIELEWGGGNARR